MNLFQRISAVMKDVEYLAKDDSVETGGGKSYRAISEEKVTSVIRASLIKNGIVIIPVSIEHARTDERVIAFDKYAKKDVERVNRISSADVTYRIQNIDEPADFILAVSAGTGVDTQDKGIGKALTYAYKYLLLRTFAIPTGDDPDKVSSDVYTENLTGERDRPRDQMNPDEMVAKLAETYSTNPEDEAKRKELMAQIDIAAKNRFSPAQVNAACKKKFGKTLMELPTDKMQEALELIKGA